MLHSMQHSVIHHCEQIAGEVAQYDWHQSTSLSSMQLLPCRPLMNVHRLRTVSEVFRVWTHLHARSLWSTVEALTGRTLPSRCSYDPPLDTFQHCSMSRQEGLERNARRPLQCQAYPTM